LKLLGGMMKMMSVIFIVPGVVSFLYFEWFSALGFALSSFASLATGYILLALFKKAEEPHSSEGAIIAAFSWFILTAIGGLPLFIIAWITPAQVADAFVPKGCDYLSSLYYFRNFLHCFFESMSAYTTTGLTMAVHEPSVGKGVLFYRSFAQWIGGAGFIVLSLSIIKYTSGKSQQLLYRSETPGLKLNEKVRDTVRSIWKAYVFVTLFLISYLIVGTYLILPGYPLLDNIFDSVNHAMSGISTGGFSCLDDSIATYRSVSMDMLYLLPMILGAFSLPFFFKVIVQSQYGLFWKDIQTRTLIISFILGGIILSLLLNYSHVVPNPFREGIFQFISAISTTGWQTSVIAVWDIKSILFIVFAAMFIGGAWGGTVGGIKIIRAIIVFNGCWWQIKKALLSPNTIMTGTLTDKKILPEEINSELALASSITIMFLVIMVVSTYISSFFIPENYTMKDALFEACAAQSTAGLSVGITEPSMNPIVECIYIFQMWIGRLEVIPVLALFRVIVMGFPKR